MALLGLKTGENMAIRHIRRPRRGSFSDTLDPTKVRLSKNFMLSDFMWSHSICTKGLKNVFFDLTGAVLEEGKYLCGSLLEPILAEYGPISVSYGYISPEVSRLTVTYQDPTKPSYHRWDKGAAADICIHSQIAKGVPPIVTAHEIDEMFGYSRMITYSESPYICVASQKGEGDKPRKAFYENRYQGVRGGRPLFIRKSTNALSRARQKEEIVLPYGWVGDGYPTYHGGGRRQYQHIRVSDYSMLSDYMNCSEYIRRGVKNVVDFEEQAPLFYRVGEVYDTLLEILDVPRLSIARAYNAENDGTLRLADNTKYFALDFIVQEQYDTASLYESVCSIKNVREAGFNEATGRFSIAIASEKR